MAMEATWVEGIAILYLTGDLDAPAAADMREVVQERLLAGDGCVVLDLTGVERMYTAGILALSELQRVAAATGRRLICCGARPFVRELLRITMLDFELDLQMDLESALRVSGQAS